MKKVLLTLVLGFGCLVATAQTDSDCGPDASPISSSCYQGCVSVADQLIGDLNVDKPRKPTPAEFVAAQRFLNDFCNGSPSDRLSFV